MILKNEKVGKNYVNRLSVLKMRYVKLNTHRKNLGFGFSYQRFEIMQESIVRWQTLTGYGQLIRKA